MIDLKQSYKRNAFCRFLRSDFLDDFREDIKEIYLSQTTKFATEVYRLGHDDSLDLEIYEIHHSSQKDARVGTAQDAFKILLSESMSNRALVAFIPVGSEQWRLSLLQIEASMDDKSSRVRKGYSNPRRHSFLLGKDAHVKTPQQYIIEKGPIRPHREGNKELSAWEDLQSRFSVETLTKEFYNELFGWYQWAVSSDSGIYFPNNTDTSVDDFEDIDKKIIRLTTRLMFVWFIKQKNLVPDDLFDENALKNILQDFNPNSMTDGKYYNAILQNLFFATLNRAIDDEEGKRGFAKLQGHRDVKTLYRYAETFKISQEEVIRLFSGIPFLNGGLFECLDKTKTIDGVEKAFNYDGFSRNDNKWSNGRYKYRAFIPNKLFFDEERGLLSILKRYNFTIEENTPSEQQVALDPELLGKVFENLLGAYNPETKETARNQSGSFYTPREIVNFMVDESLIAYLGNTPTVRSLFRNDFTLDPLHWSEYQRIAGLLKSVKILDPACGSGAFPMGLLNRIVELLQKIEPEKSTYDLKLNIIENCLYGSDIQSIAAQITKLRFFISLICSCEKDLSKPNFGIPTLPNLETKFVTANSLIGLKKIKKGDFTGTLFENPEIETTKQALSRVRHEHFMAKTASAKARLRRSDQELREKLASLLSADKDFAPEDAKQMAAWNPYDQNAISPFFDPEWMFGVIDGFDIVIGNPPYIQLQNNGGELAQLYEGCGYSTFARTGDIYCLFYERGWQLLKKNGHLCYITSNKWMRAGYGEKTREFFANKTNPILLIDFAGVKIFESATVDTNILLFSKSNNLHKTICAVTNKQNKESVKNLSDFVQQQNSLCDFHSFDSWVILSPIEQSIKRKIESVGTPLKDWDIQINYGIKTGFNDAFIISTEKRDEILANCKDATERHRTAELIRPILRGRDIKRYGYDWANLYLIATFPSRHYDINQFPSVKQYLLSFGIERLEQTGRSYVINGEKVKARKTTHNKWFETQDSISYWEDFSRPKIIYPETTQGAYFAFDDKGLYIDKTCFMLIAEDAEYLQHTLSSRLFEFAYKRIFASVELGEHGYQYNKHALVKLPVIQPDKSFHFDINNIDEQIYKLYGISNEEVQEIENN